MKSSLHSLIHFLLFLLNRLWLPSQDLDPILCCNRQLRNSTQFWQLSLSLGPVLGPTVSRPGCLILNHTSGAYYQIFITVGQLRFLLMWSALSDERTGLSFTVAAGPHQHSFSGPSPLGLATIFYCLRFETSLFIASYDSQGYGECIRPRLHTLYGPNKEHLFQQPLLLCVYRSVA
jgi:hypothetical protein